MRDREKLCYVLTACVDAIGSHEGLYRSHFKAEPQGDVVRTQLLESVDMLCSMIPRMAREVGHKEAETTDD